MTTTRSTKKPAATKATTKKPAAAAKASAKPAAKASVKPAVTATNPPAAVAAKAKPAAATKAKATTASKAPKGPRETKPGTPTTRTSRAPKKATATEPTLPKRLAPPTDDGLPESLRALALALDKKALDPVLLDVRGLCSYCNYQLILSGRSDRQVEAIADGIRSGLRAQKDSISPLGSEGARSGQWSLLDYGDFIVHVFSHTIREHYDLEGLWSDAPRVVIDVPAEARILPGDYA